MVHIHFPKLYVNFVCVLVVLDIEEHEQSCFHQINSKSITINYTYSLLGYTNLLNFMGHTTKFCNFHLRLFIITPWNLFWKVVKKINFSYLSAVIGHTCYLFLLFSKVSKFVLWDCIKLNSVIFVYSCLLHKCTSWFITNKTEDPSVQAARKKLQLQ